jgi:hypothetical protein
MGTLGDILSSNDPLGSLRIQAGSIFLGPMEGVDHMKFYIIAGVSGNKICACSVVINSHINQFIIKRPKLLDLQVEILKDNYEFLDHNSYVNCANPIVGTSNIFNRADFIFKDVLNDDDLTIIVGLIKKSGMLTQEQIEMFF